MELGLTRILVTAREKPLNTVKGLVGGFSSSTNASPSSSASASGVGKKRRRIRDEVEEEVEKDGKGKGKGKARVNDSLPTKRSKPTGASHDSLEPITLLTAAWKEDESKARRTFKDVVKGSKAGVQPLSIQSQPSFLTLGIPYCKYPNFWTIVTVYGARGGYIARTG